MSDHYHHASEVQGAADDRHGHPDLERDISGVESDLRNHRHYDLEHDGETAQKEIRRLFAAINELQSDLDAALARISALETQTPGVRQAELEAAQAAAGLAESGYVEGLTAECRDRWHDRCPAGVSCDCRCHVDEDQGEEPAPEEYDPGPEIDDEGGMSEYRYVLPEDYGRGQS